MNTGNRMNTLLVELLIVVFFFMLGVSVLMQVFGKAHEFSEEAGQITEALARAQSVSDRLYLSEDPEKELYRQGFSPCNPDRMKELEDLPSGYDSMTFFESDAEGYTLLAGLQQADEAADTEGMLYRMQVSIVRNDTVLATLPCSHYAEGAA